MRLDVFLTENGFFQSRSKAQSAINAGNVSVDGSVNVKPSTEVSGNESIQVRNTERFVSRAGEKLDFALSEFGIDVTGLVALDIGASTGGFTDCLLQRGAEYVYALDVGQSQLDPSLRSDGRVGVIEGFNARNARRNDFERDINIIVMDVSFISQALIYPACADILNKGRMMVTLIKPQFEAGRKNIGKGGIVRDGDRKIIKEILVRLDAEAEGCGFKRIGFADSPILGGDGNREYLAVFEKLTE